MPIPIISTKLYIPPPRPESVIRPRLTEMFENGLHRKATLVSAPAGFGKSTLVNQCASDCDRDVAWLSLDEADGDLKRFLTYVIAALQQVMAEFGKAILASVEAQQPPPDETLLVLLLNELAAMGNDLLLVLDDFHLIDSNEVDEALIFMLEHLPPQLHLVIATREDPQFPLARWRAKGQLAELRAADLRFTAAEASAFLNQTMNLALSEENIAALEVRTEGWIAGLQMAALSLQGRADHGEFIDAFTGSHRFVLDYLVEEVLQRQNEKLREFLLQTAILDQLHGSLCDAVTGQTDSESRLQLLDEENLFVLPLDDHRSWYRYHHLFGDMLRARLMQEQKGLLPALHLRASRWFEKQDFPNEAIRHALAAVDFDHAALLIEQIWPDLRKTASETLFLSWMKRLPEDQVLCRPVLCGYFGLALLSGELQRGILYFDAAEKWLKQPREKANSNGMVINNEAAFTELPGLIAVGRAYQAGAEGDLEGIAHHAQRALDLLDNQAAIWRGSAAVLLGLVYWNQGKLEAAYEAISDGHASLKTGGEISGAISTLYLMANLRIALGNSLEAIRLCDVGQKLAGKADGPAPQGTYDIYVTLAAIKTEQNELDAAENLLEEARKLGPQAVLLESRHLWYVVKARIESCRGNYEAALQLLDEAEEQQLPSPAPSPMPLSAWRARVQILKGQFFLVEEWAKTHHLAPDDEPSYLREFEYFVLVRLLIAQYRHLGEKAFLQKAKNLLELLLDSAKAGNRQQRVVESLVLLSLVADAMGEKKSATSCLSSALNMAEPQSNVRVFLDEGQPMQGLLKKLLSSRVAPNFVAKLLSAFGGMPFPNEPSQTQVLPEPLSDRELDVLRLLGSELTGPEIANQLFVSLNTMRTHTKNIYSKLAVNSRRAAVKRSEELGLV